MPIAVHCWAYIGLYYCTSFKLIFDNSHTAATSNSVNIIAPSWRLRTFYFRFTDTNLHTEIKSLLFYYTSLQQNCKNDNELGMEFCTAKCVGVRKHGIRQYRETDKLRCKVKAKIALTINPSLLSFCTCMSNWVSIRFYYEPKF